MGASARGAYIGPHMDHPLLWLLPPRGPVGCPDHPSPSVAPLPPPSQAFPGLSALAAPGPLSDPARLVLAPLPEQRPSPPPRPSEFPNLVFLRPRLGPSAFLAGTPPPPAPGTLPPGPPPPQGHAPAGCVFSGLGALAAPGSPSGLAPPRLGVPPTRAQSPRLPASVGPELGPTATSAAAPLPALLPPRGPTLGAQAPPRRVVLTARGAPSAAQGDLGATPSAPVPSAAPPGPGPVPVSGPQPGPPVRAHQPRRPRSAPGAKGPPTPAPPATTLADVVFGHPSVAAALRNHRRRLSLPPAPRPAPIGPRQAEAAPAHAKASTLPPRPRVAGQGAPRFLSAVLVASALALGAGEPFAGSAAQGAWRPAARPCPPRLAFLPRCPPPPPPVVPGRGRTAGRDVDPVGEAALY